ncbi:MAG: hypothetical protein OXB84_08310, partial [Halobacteriovoraceae bacterium]|nr:hypothetical protein [Halobacteriovoraceae bacterium]
MLIKVLSISLMLASFSLWADVVRGNKIDIEGIVDKQAVRNNEIINTQDRDNEVEHFQTELKKVKFQNKNNKKKVGLLKKLSTEMDRLSNTHEEYFMQRVEWEEKVSEFNKKMDCLQKKGGDCDGQYLS